jgi:hypothetical protein
MKGFNPQWCTWVQNIISGGSVGMKINDDIRHYFQKMVSDKKILCPLSCSVLWQICSPF